MAAKKKRKKLSSGAPARKKTASATRKSPVKKKASNAKAAKRGARKPVVRRKTGKKASSAKKKSTPEIDVTVAAANGKSLTLTTGTKMQEFAMRWRYAVSRRLRWKDAPRRDTQKEVLEALQDKLGITRTALKDVLGDAAVLEVQIPYIDEGTAWEARVAPWEFLLSSSAAALGNHKSLSIVRCLQTGRKRHTVPKKPRVLFVQCTPGVLDGSYEFSTERAALEHAFGGAVIDCVNPTIDELETVIRREKPDVIHLAGIDNNQAREILRDRGDLSDEWLSRNELDGIVCAVESDDPEHPRLEPVHAEDLARILNCSSKPLSLVTANVYHSASRICALAVAHGAELALGFQDTVHDTLAEIVLRDFYTNWLSSHKPLPAFVSSLDVARSAVSLSGTGIVLWSARSLLDGALESVSSVRAQRKRAHEQTLRLDEDWPTWFNVDVRVRDRLNYSLLHNDSGGLFEALEFRKEKEGILYDVGVEVVLYLGSESHPYNASFRLNEYLTKVDDKIKIPLTSSLIRTVSEPLRTSLYVRITVGDRVMYKETHRVTLLPADEWKDTDTDRIWLPSFVLPRDIAVERIIERAQNHLVTLSDDRARGFDGYQSIDEDDPDTFGEIDIQVQAIWAAIVGDFGVRYINPPPSYTRLGQRLRTPTQILRGGRGTCIDLALLLCACLEYVEIYPVVFLLEGHAFAGYWRSENRYDAFASARQAGLESSTMLQSIGSTTDRSAWILPSDSYAEILNEVNSGFLYPVETVGFTTHGSFWEAIEEGVDNLRSRSEFHSLIDIWRARREFITPLPIIDDIVELRGGSRHD